MKVDRVEDVLDDGVDHDGEQDGVLEAEHELHAGPLGEGGGVGVLDEEHVQRGEDEGEGEDPQVEEERDDGGALHVVHSVLRQPVERLEEQQQGEQSHELGGEVISAGQQTLRPLSLHTVNNLLEHSECQTSFCDRVPTSLHQMLKLCCSELSKEYFSHQLAHEYDHHQRLKATR